MVKAHESEKLILEEKYSSREEQIEKLKSKLEQLWIRFETKKFKLQNLPKTQFCFTFQKFKVTLSRHFDISSVVENMIIRFQQANQEQDDVREEQAKEYDFVFLFVE